MQFQPEPTGLVAPRGVERLTSHNSRNIFCPHYQGCLDLAVRSDWADWTCGRCPLRSAAEGLDVRDYAHKRPRGPTDV